MIHSASPQSRPWPAVMSRDFEVLGWTDGRTFCVKIVITAGRDSGRPRGSIQVENSVRYWRDWGWLMGSLMITVLHNAEFHISSFLPTN